MSEPPSLDVIAELDKTASRPLDVKQDSYRRLRLQLLLLLLTVLTTTLAGVGIAHDLSFSLISFSTKAPFIGLGAVLHALWGHPGFFIDGLGFSLPLMGILVTHEMGHYFVARYYGVPASLPYFIPLPLGLGTLGAIIGMRPDDSNRGVLLEIGAAGPIAGFVLAFAVLLIGFAHSEVKSAQELALIAAGGGLVVEGDSLVYALARWLVFGKLAPGSDVWIHPTVWAGWVGMYLTWFNLQPFGQFDGGHVAAAVLGDKAKWLARGVFVYLGLLFVITLNPFWIVLSVIMLILGQFIGVQHPPLQILQPLTLRHKFIALIALLLFFVTLVPNPWHQVEMPAASPVNSGAEVKK